MTTILPDKDAPVATTLAKIDSIFARLDLSVTIAAEYHPVSSCWSHHILLDDSPSLATNGKGETRDASLASGFAEMVERFVTGSIFAEYGLCRGDCSFYFHPRERKIHIKKLRQPIQRQRYDNVLLTPELLEFYDPEKELLASHLQDSNYDDADRGIILLPFTPLAEEGGDCVWFPVALLDNLYATNGLAAGNSRWECMNQAICEIFERHVKYRVIADGIALPDFPEELLAGYPRIIAQRSALEAAGYRLWLKDASLGGQFPVAAIILLDTGGGVFTSFGCSCYLDVALGRAFTEMLQGRQLEGLSGFSRPETILSAYADSGNLEHHFINSEGLVPLGLLRTVSGSDFADDFWHGIAENRGISSHSEHRYLCRLIEQAGYYGYKLEYDCCGFSACRIVIPAMSEIYPPDELLWNNRNRGSWLRAVLLKLPRMKEKKLSQVAERLERAAFSAEELVSSLIGVAFAGQSVWGQLRIGELTALLYLALLSRQQDASPRAMEYGENARSWCRWVIEYSGITQQRIRIYMLLEQLVTIELQGGSRQEYMTFFQAAFSAEELALAENILDGRARFWGLEFAQRWEDISPEHKEVLRIFTRYQQASAAAEG